MGIFVDGGEQLPGIREQGASNLVHVCDLKLGPRRRPRA
jgi:hypothetical protein